MTATATRLIAREPEIERLVGAVESAAEGRPAFVLVLGEAGIGKSALLQATIPIATARGLRVLVGTALETGGGIPYLPLVGPLGSALDGDSDDAAVLTVRRVVRGVPPTRASRRRLASSSDVDAAAGAARFIEAVFDVLVRRPTLLIVDDIHWADRSTLTVLDYLARRATDVPLAVVAAARDDEADAIARLPIADGRRFDQLPLRRLSRADVAQQIAALLGRQVSGEVADRVFRRSAGNPMFVEELIHAGAGTDAASDLAAADGAMTSAALRGLVLGRVRRLSEPARAAVEGLAILGRPAEEGLVGPIAGLDPERAGTALDEAVRGGVAMMSATGFEARHPIVAEVVAGSIPASRRRRLHRRAGEALESSAGGAVGERARHWWLAGEDRKAWSAYLEAADEAEGAFAFAEAWAALERATELWPADAPGLAAARLRTAEAAWMSGDAARALDLARVVESEVESDEELGRLEAFVATGRYAWDAGERETAVRAFARAWEQLDERTAPAMRARALWGLGRGEIGAGRFEKAYELAAESARAAAAAEEPSWEGEAWLLAGMARAWAGADGIPEVRRGLQLATDSGHPGCSGHGFQFLVDLVALAGHREEAIEEARRGIAIADRLGTASTHGSDLRGRAALLLLDAGRSTDAEAVLGPADPRAFPSLARAYLAMRRGDFAAADEAVAAGAIGGAIGGPGALGGWLELARAELAWLRGDLHAARRELGRLRRPLGVWGVDVWAWSELWAARLGLPNDPERPGAVINAELDRAIAAEIAAERSEPGSPIRPAAWATAADAWSALGRPYDEAWARLRQADAGFAGRDRGAARAALHEAARLADGLNAGPLRGRVEDLARRARVSARPVRRAVPDPMELTARERDVLALLAEGRTNRQIAERLFLSPKTVGIHVSRILDKLGAATRGEAVAAARRAGDVS